jgi:hypothetical protein
VVLVAVAAVVTAQMVLVRRLAAQVAQVMMRHHSEVKQQPQPCMQAVAQAVAHLAQAAQAVAAMRAQMVAPTQVAAVAEITIAAQIAQDKAAPA